MKLLRQDPIPRYINRLYHSRAGQDVDLSMLPSVLKLLIFLSFTVTLTVAMPSWVGGGWMDGYAGLRQSSIGNIVPAASFIEAIVSGVNPNQRYRPKYLGVGASKGLPSHLRLLKSPDNWLRAGVPGPAVIYENPSPPLFFINERQLWQLTNQTSILQMNVIDVTDIAGNPAPLKLEFGDKKEGISEGLWRWRGTMLHYDLGKSTNKGLFFSCGVRGVYMALEE